MDCLTTSCPSEIMDNLNENTVIELHKQFHRRLIQILKKFYGMTYNVNEVNEIMEVIRDLQLIKFKNQAFFNSTKGKPLKEFNELLLSIAIEYVEVCLCHRHSN